MLESSLLGALHLYYARLDRQPVNWAITASCGLALQGVPVSVRDVDLATDRAGAYRLEQLFADEMIRPVRFSGKDASVARRMADPSFRAEQMQHRYDTHIAPINWLVDSLRKSESGWLPYVAPMYGGVNARLLSLLRDPGPMTQDSKGSGFLSMENDDPTAEAICKYFEDAGIRSQDIVPWNAYPWYINRGPKRSELNAGIEPLRHLIQLLPRLRVVMVHGRDAQKGWQILRRAYPNIVAERELYVIETFHTSRQAFWHPDPAVRESRRVHLRDSFAEAAQILKNIAT